MQNSNQQRDIELSPQQGDRNFDDVLESVLSSIEETLSKDDSTEKLKRIEKDIASLEKKRKKLTDMYLDDKLTKEAYDDKYSELSKKLDK